MNEHPHRGMVSRELHARPFISVDAPVRVLHLALLHEDDDGAESRDCLQRLLERHGISTDDAPITNHFITQLHGTRLKWERHAEFTSWTLWRDAAGAEPFAEPPSTDLDVDWLDELPGQLLVALRMHVLAPGNPTPGTDRLNAMFDPTAVCGSRLGEGKYTEIWTDFRPDTTGHVRMLLHDHGGDDRQLGRRVQRLLEIETYRCMALLGLPVVRDVAPCIAEVEERLAEMTHGLEIFEDVEPKKSQLEKLMQLSALSEDLAASTAYRFSASAAYFAIVGERLEQLAEEPLGELPTIGGFMARRLSPAMRTCTHTRVRLESLADRITRAANLLRTQVDLALEAQNQRLPLSMERRARLQLRLQQTVEGLSVAAITYYVVGLVAYLTKAAQRSGVSLDADLITGIAVPVVAVFIWSGVRRMHHHIAKDEQGPG